MLYRSSTLVYFMSVFPPYTATVPSGRLIALQGSPLHMVREMQPLGLKRSKQNKMPK
jgi:hypothetical protein